VLKLYPMFIQGLWPRNSPLLQLPHLTDQNVLYLTKNRVKNCQDLASLTEHKRRSLLNTVDESEYNDIITVLTMMPSLDIDTRIEVQGEDDRETVTVGSIVTLKVMLKRTSLLDSRKREAEILDGPVKVEKPEPENEQPKRKVWEKQKPKKKTNKGKGGKKVVVVKKKVESTANEATTSKDTSENQPQEGSSKTTNDKLDVESVNDSSSGSDSSASDEEEFNKPEYDQDLEPSGSDNEDFWDDDDPVVKKEILLDSEPTNHHPVHCPLFPSEKNEWWFLYLTEKKTNRLVSMIVPCKTLDREKEVELRFSAPPQKGMYYYILNVRSDSYVNADYVQEVKIQVQAAREPVQIKYEDTDDDVEHSHVSESEDEYTEGSVSDDD